MIKFVWVVLWSSDDMEGWVVDSVFTQEKIAKEYVAQQEFEADYQTLYKIQQWKLRGE